MIQTPPWFPINLRIKYKLTTMSCRPCDDLVLAVHWSCLLPSSLSLMRASHTGSTAVWKTTQIQSTVWISEGATQKQQANSKTRCLIRGYFTEIWMVEWIQCNGEAWRLAGSCKHSKPKGVWWKNRVVWSSARDDHHSPASRAVCHMVGAQEVLCRWMTEWINQVI